MGRSIVSTISQVRGARRSFWLVKTTQGTSVLLVPRKRSSSSLSTLSFENRGQRWSRGITGVQETLTPSVVRRILNGWWRKIERWTCRGETRMGTERTEGEYGIIFVRRCHWALDGRGARNIFEQADVRETGTSDRAKSATFNFHQSTFGSRAINGRPNDEYDRATLVDNAYDLVQHFLKRMRSRNRNYGDSTNAEWFRAFVTRLRAYDVDGNLRRYLLCYCD